MGYGFYQKNTNFDTMKYSNIILIDDDIDDQEIFREALAKAAPHVVCKAMSNAKDALLQLAEKAIAAAHCSIVWYTGNKDR